MFSHPIMVSDMFNPDHVATGPGVVDWRTSNLPKFPFKVSEKHTFKETEEVLLKERWGDMEDEDDSSSHTPNCPDWVSTDEEDDKRNKGGKGLERPALKAPSETSFGQRLSDSGVGDEKFAKVVGKSTSTGTPKSSQLDKAAREIAHKLEESNRTNEELRNSPTESRLVHMQPPSSSNNGKDEAIDVDADESMVEEQNIAIDPNDHAEMTAWIKKNLELESFSF
jgi:hypothetical protein